MNKAKRKSTVFQSDLIIRPRWANALPDIPFEPKALGCRLTIDRHIAYKPSNLEKEYCPEIIAPADLGVIIELVNPAVYENPDNVKVELTAEDMELLKDDSLHTTPGSSNSSYFKDQKRSEQHRRIIPWLKKTEYISNEFNKFGRSAEKTDSLTQQRAKMLIDQSYNGVEVMSREEQMKIIEKQFEDAKNPITKYAKKGVHPVEIMPLLPDEECWKYPFAQVLFDNEPVVALNTKTQRQAETEMSQALVRGVVNDNGEHSAAYFVPTEETAEKRRKDDADGVLYDPNQTYEYIMVREYRWLVKRAEETKEDYFFTFRDDGVFYKSLETKVRLRRMCNSNMSRSNNILAVKHKPVEEADMTVYDNNLRALMPLKNLNEEEEISDIINLNQEEGDIFLPFTNSFDTDLENDSGLLNNNNSAVLNGSSGKSINRGKLENFNYDSESNSSEHSEASSLEADDNWKKLRAKNCEEEIFGSD